MVQILCDGARRERAAQEIRRSRRLGGSAACVNALWVSWREGIRGSCEFCAGHPGTETQDDVGYAGSEKTEFPWIAKRAAKFIDQLGHIRVTLRCENEPVIEALAREIAQARQEGSQTVPERSTVGESQSNGIIERAVGLVAGQARTLKAALEHRIGARVPPDARILCWLVEFFGVLDEQVRHRQGRKDTAARTTRGRRDNTPILEFGEKILCMPAKPARGGQWEPRFHPGVFVGMLNSSSEAVVVSAGTGDQDKVGEHQESTRVGEMGR